MARSFSAGDERIPQAIDTLTHGVTIRRPARDVWPWLVQMGAGSRGGWYSYDWLDNGRKPGASRIVPELQHPAIGTIFPALPGVTEGFTLLAMGHEQMLMLGWPAPDGTPEVTWTFVLDEVAPGVTRLLVRARGGPGYRFHGLPLLLTRLVSRVAHFIMQRKQLLGIMRRAESTPAETLVPWEEPCLPSHHTLAKRERSVRVNDVELQPKGGPACGRVRRMEGRGAFRAFDHAQGLQSEYPRVRVSITRHGRREDEDLVACFLQAPAERLDGHLDAVECGQIAVRKEADSHVVAPVRSQSEYEEVGARH